MGEFRDYNDFDDVESLTQMDLLDQPGQEFIPRSRRPVRAIPNFEDRPPHPAQDQEDMDTDDYWRSD